MSPPNLQDTDFSVSVSEAPLFGEAGTLVWKPVYFDIRNSAQGLSIIDGVLAADGEGWSSMYPAERITEEQLRAAAPESIVDHLLTKITL